MRLRVQLLFIVAFSAIAIGQLLGGKGKGGGLLNLGGLTKPLEDVVNTATNLLTEEFGIFKKTHKKSYSSPEEEKKRLEIYSKNHNHVLDLNKVLDLPYKLKINELADLGLEEFNKLLNGLRINKDKSSASRVEPKQERVNVSDNVDWRTKGAVTLARSQGLCGSCYAFAAAGALEAQYFLKGKKLQYLSPQNIMDCTKGSPYDNNGCAGGSVDPAYDFIKSNGIDPDTVYPYEEKLGPSCRFVKDKSAGNVNGYVLLAEGDENGLEHAVRTVGPVATGIDAHAKSFQFYSEGLYYEPNCSSSIDDLNHAVLIIGFGTEPNGEKYWLFKNSYGPSWGTNGFGKLSRNITNHCGIATYAIYPLL